jgi:hypothetical protein
MDQAHHGVDMFVFDGNQQGDVAFTQKTTFATNACDTMATGGEGVDEVAGILTLNHGYH